MQDQEWRRRAACLADDVDPGWFYSEDYWDQAFAMKVCDGADGRPGCPVRDPCLEYALSINEEHGIWGGLSERARKRVRRDRRASPGQLAQGR